MPHTYIPRPRSARNPYAPMQAVAARANNPYRGLGPDPLVNGVSNLAAALFNGPIQRAQIERQSRAQTDNLRFQQDRAAKEDMFREREAQWRHEDAQQRNAAAAAKTANHEALPARFSPYKHVETVNPDTGKITHGEELRSDSDIHAARRALALYQGKPVAEDDERGAPGITPAQMIRDNFNPNGGEISPQNPYLVPMSPQDQAHNDMFMRAHAEAAGIPGAAPAPQQAALPPGVDMNHPALQDPNAQALAQHPVVQELAKRAGMLPPGDQQIYAQILKSGDPAKIKAANDLLLNTQMQQPQQAPQQQQRPDLMQPPQQLPPPQGDALERDMARHRDPFAG